MRALWPQITVLVLMAIGMGFSVARYGQPKTDTYDWGDILFAPAFVFWLLYMGGFFDGFSR